MLDQFDYEFDRTDRFTILKRFALVVVLTAVVIAGAVALLTVTFATG